MSVSSLKLEEINDREILWIVADLADGPEEWVAAQDIARKIGIRRPKMYATSRQMTDAEFERYRNACVAARLSWLRRFGAVEKGEHTHEWRLTPLGHAVRTGELSPEQEQLLLDLDDTALVSLVGAVSTRYRGTNGAGHLRDLMRREWVYGTHKRRFGRS